MSPSFDVAVIGAGLAGIAAAQRLSQSGRRVAVIEARPRFGGRVWTRRDPASGWPLELGPEWFNPSGPIHRLLADRGLEVAAGSGSFLRRVEGELRSLEEIGDGWDELRRRLAELGGADRTLAAALMACGSEPRLRTAAAMLRQYVEGFHGADPEGLSLHWLREVEANQSAGEAEFRSHAGLDQAVEAALGAIGSSATVFLDTSVTGVRWRRGSVLVDCISGRRAGTIAAAAAIVTLPLAVLSRTPGSRGAVTFSPPLVGKAGAFDLLATGPAMKLNLVFDAPFWLDLPRLDDALFLQDFAQPIPTWWTTAPAAVPVLVGWAAGPQVRRVGSLTATRLRRTAIRSLAAALGASESRVANRLVGMHWHDWQRDPWARGAYSWVRSGGRNAWRILAAPVSQTLFFAGEATQGGGYNATMDGAFESGLRAADEVLATSRAGGGVRKPGPTAGRAGSPR